MSFTSACTGGLLTAWLLLGQATALAQAGPPADPLASMTDPTRPPVAFRKPAPGQVSPANGGTAPAAEDEETSRVPRLQAIHRDPRTGRASAMLDDQIRQPGERVGAWAVLAIDADSVVLRGTPGVVRLRLLGGHEKIKQWRGTSAPSPRKDQP
jgi:hypothetical protein